jgi:hypothetical protein
LANFVVDFAEPSRSRPAGLLVKAERAVKLGVRRQLEHPADDN